MIFFAIFNMGLIAFGCHDLEIGEIGFGVFIIVTSSLSILITIITITNRCK